MKFGLKAEQIAAMGQCFARYPAIAQVIIYGSRAKGTHWPASDIDLVLIEEGLPYGKVLHLMTELDDLLLPYFIDLARKCDIQNPDLLEHIERVGQVFYQRDTFLHQAKQAHAANKMV